MKKKLYRPPPSHHLHNHHSVVALSTADLQLHIQSTGFKLNTSKILYTRPAACYIIFTCFYVNDGNRYPRAGVAGDFNPQNFTGQTFGRGLCQGRRQSLRLPSADIKIYIRYTHLLCQEVPQCLS